MTSKEQDKEPQAARYAMKELTELANVTTSCSCKNHLIQAVERSWSGPWGHSHIHVTACIG